MIAPGYRMSQLREGLVGEDHARLYHESATFRRAVDTLVAMLPRWIDGLAADAAEQDRRVEERIATMSEPEFVRRVDRALLEANPVRVERGPVMFHQPEED